MIAVVMFHAVVISLLIVPAAMLADRAAALWRVPRRWGWAAAVIATVTMPGLAFLRTMAVETRPVLAVEASGSAASSVVFTTWSVISSGVQDRLSAVAVALAAVEPWALIIWMLASAVVALLYGSACIALLRRRRKWSRVVVNDVPVLLAGDTGPAVVGIVSPAIVLPSWALALDSTSLDLILRHEYEHLRARDPWFVYLSAFGTLLMPWHPGVWWLARRLRLAIEFDCDARVLASGRGGADDVASYGELLLAVATRCRRETQLAIPALIESSSTLSKRIAAMCPSRSRFVRTEIAVAVVGALLLTAGACSAPAPPSATDDGASVAAPPSSGAAGVVTTEAHPSPAPGVPATEAPPASPRVAAPQAPPAPSTQAQPTPAPSVPATAPLRLDGPVPGVTNPVPLSRPQPTYTTDAMRRKVQGQVQVEVVVSAEGKVTDARVLRSLDPELDGQAVKAAREWTFRPARRDGKPVAIVVMLEMEFTIH